MSEETETLAEARFQDINATLMWIVSGGPDSSVMILLSCSWKNSLSLLRRMCSSLSHRVMTTILRSSGLLDTIIAWKPSSRCAAGRKDCRVRVSTRGMFSGETRRVVMRTCTGSAPFARLAALTHRVPVLARSPRRNAEKKAGMRDVLLGGWA